MEEGASKVQLSINKMLQKGKAAEGLRHTRLGTCLEKRKKSIGER
jgi:hypothetical protein